MSLPKLDYGVPSFVSQIENTVPKTLLMGPGPVNYHPDVLKALSTPLVAPFDDEMVKLMEEIKDGIRYVFQTSSRLTFAFSGAAMAAMECVVTNLIAPGEKLLIMSRGNWDIRAADIGRRHGAVVIEVVTQPETTFTLAQIEDALETHRPAGIFITHGDSSTGTVQHLEGVGELCQKYGALSMIDVVVSIGAVPFLMDAWKLDAVYAGGQKSLSAPAGLSPIAFNARAQEKIWKQKQSKIWYYDVKAIADQWNCFQELRAYHHTSCSPLLFALRAALKVIADEGLQQSWKRHIEIAKYLYSGLEKLGIGLLVPKFSDRLAVVTPITFKDNDYKEMMLYLRNKCYIVVNQGLGPTAGKCMRVGTMGQNGTKECVDRLLSGLKEALIETKKSKY